MTYVKDTETILCKDCGFTFELCICEYKDELFPEEKDGEE